MDVLPFTHFSDYSDDSLPSAIYDPHLRKAYAKIYNARKENDFSFCIADESGHLAYCLLCLDTRTSPFAFWALGAPATFWFTGTCPPEMQNAVAKKAVVTIKKRVQEYPESIVSYAEFFPNGALTAPAMYFMQTHECISSLAFVHKIDLLCPETMLRTKLRDSYKSLINKGMNLFSFVVLDQYSSQHKDINALHECHITASGRDVYPISFWTVWQREIDAGRAFVVLAKQGEQARGACLCTISKSAAYYGIGAFDRSLNDTGLSHACLWQSICHAKKIGLPLFEMGKTYFPCLKPDITDKEMSIGFFKRGFGGSNLPILHLRTTSLAGEGVDEQLLLNSAHK